MDAGAVFHQEYHRLFPVKTAVQLPVQALKAGVGPGALARPFGHQAE